MVVEEGGVEVGVVAVVVWVAEVVAVWEEEVAEAVVVLGVVADVGGGVVDVAEVAAGVVAPKQC